MLEDVDGVFGRGIKRGNLDGDLSVGRFGGGDAFFDGGENRLVENGGVVMKLRRHQVSRQQRENGRLGFLICNATDGRWNYDVESYALREKCVKKEVDREKYGRREGRNERMKDR